MIELKSKYSRTRALFSLSLIITIIVGSMIIIINLESSPIAFYVQAQDIIVDEAGNGNYTTIQSAIDNATPGDTIYVWEGVYRETLVINKSISLIGNDSINTTIDGEQSGDVIALLSDYVNITGFNITNSTLTDHRAGIYIGGSYNVIDEDVLYKNLHGIYLSYGSYNIISNNTFLSNVYDGIYSPDIGNANIIANNLFVNYSTGIRLYSINHIGTVIENNIMINGMYGILCGPMEWMMIRDNRISKTEVGIDIYDCKYVTLRRNIMNNCGISIFGNDANFWTLHDIDKSNLVNEKPVIYLANENNVDIKESSGQVIIAYCSGINVVNQNFTSGSPGVWVAHSTFVNISNSQFDKCYTFDNHYDKTGGIVLYRSEFNSIYNNTLTNMIKGIYIGNGKDNEVSRNSIDNCNYGIFLMDSLTTHIAHNRIEMCTINGIEVNVGSQANTITDNYLENNTNSGVYIERSLDTQVFHNNLIYNDVKIDRDDGTTVFYVDDEGNYWWDYNGEDTGDNQRVKGDHIGDTKIPYEGIDYYPFDREWGWRYPWTPVLTGPEWDTDGNFTLTWGSTRRSSRYIVEEDIIDTFSTPTIVYDGWDIGESVSANISENEANVYYYRIRAINDIYAGDWSDTHIVTVYPTPQVPSNLEAEPMPSGTAINVHWDPNDDETEKYELQYNNNGIWETLQLIMHPENLYLHLGLEYNRTYDYRLRAVDTRDAYSAFTHPVSGTTIDTTPPQPPLNLHISKIHKYNISLAWDASPDPDVVGYLMYRSTAQDGGYICINESPLTNISYVDEGLDDDATYYYRATAVDMVPLESLPSNIVSGTTERGLHVLIINDTMMNIEIEEDIIDDSSINLNDLFIDIKGNQLEYNSEEGNNIEIDINEDDGSVILTPAENWNGEEILTFYASDGVYEIEWKINITVVGVNDPPEMPVIEKPVPGSLFREGDSLTFTAHCGDPDIPYGDALEYQWTSNISGDIGEGPSLHRVELPTGNHSITLNVSDKEGEFTLTSVDIIISSDTPPNPLDNNSDGNNSDENSKEGLSKAAVFTIAIIIIVVVLICFLFIFLYRRKRSMNKLDTEDESEFSQDKVSKETMSIGSLTKNTESLKKWTPKTMITSKQEALKILGLGIDASLDEIRVKYRELAKENHPDIQSTMEDSEYEVADNRMKQINDAYQFLKKYEVGCTLLTKIKPINQSDSFTNGS